MIKIPNGFLNERCFFKFHFFFVEIASSTLLSFFIFKTNFWPKNLVFNLKSFLLLLKKYGQNGEIQEAGDFGTDWVHPE